MLTLLEQLTDPDPAVRVAALAEIGQWDTDTEDPALVERAVSCAAAALQDSARAVRWEAAYALGALAHPAGIAPLEAALSRAAADGDTGLQLVIVKALGKIGTAEAIPTLRMMQQADTPCLQVAARLALRRAGADGDTPP